MVEFAGHLPQLRRVKQVAEEVIGSITLVGGALPPAREIVDQLTRGQLLRKLGTEVSKAKEDSWSHPVGAVAGESASKEAAGSGAAEEKAAEDGKGTKSKARAGKKTPRKNAAAMKKAAAKEDVAEIEEEAAPEGAEDGTPAETVALRGILGFATCTVGRSQMYPLDAIPDLIGFQSAHASHACDSADDVKTQKSATCCCRFCESSSSWARRNRLRTRET